MKVFHTRLIFLWILKCILATTVFPQAKMECPVAKEGKESPSIECIIKVPYKATFMGLQFDRNGTYITNCSSQRCQQNNLYEASVNKTELGGTTTISSSLKIKKVEIQDNTIWGCSVTLDNFSNSPRSSCQLRVYTSCLTKAGNGLEFSNISIGVIMVLILIIVALVTVIIVYRRRSIVKMNQADARVSTEMTLTREPCNIRTSDCFTPNAGHDDNGGYITPASPDYVTSKDETFIGKTNQCGDYLGLTADDETEKYRIPTLPGRPGMSTAADVDSGYVAATSEPETVVYKKTSDYDVLSEDEVIVHPKDQEDEEEEDQYQTID